MGRLPISGVRFVRFHTPITIVGLTMLRTRAFLGRFAIAQGTVVFRQFPRLPAGAGTILHRSRIRQALLQAPPGREYGVVAGRAAPTRDVGLNCGQLRSAGHRLNFVGIGFRHTSWLAPSSAEGYASQQRGSYLAGWIPGLPSDPIRDCSWGCRAFETMRNR
jgi:hypothetical protein